MHDTARDVEKVDSGENNARDRQYLRKVFRQKHRDIENRKEKEEQKDKD